MSNPLNLIKIYDICKNKEILLKSLQEWGLVPKIGEFYCPKCDEPMRLFNQGDRDWRWTCLNKISVRKQAAKPCGKKVEFRTGTFFARSKLDYFEILGFSHLWAEGLQLRQIALQLGIGSDHTLVDWSSFCREVKLNLGDLRC
jgi:hypothetical protein